jgi:hypothetical protein
LIRWLKPTAIDKKNLTLKPTAIDKKNLTLNSTAIDKKIELMSKPHNQRQLIKHLNSTAIDKELKAAVDVSFIPNKTDFWEILKRKLIN